MKRHGFELLTWIGAKRGVTLSEAPAQPGRSNAADYILVVEDDFLVRLMVSDSLREAGFNVIEAFNADEAIYILRSGVPVDLMLSDVRMPGTMDGLELLEHSRRTYPDIPVIMMSGHLAAHEALSRGASHFLAKPYSFQTALTLIGQELARTR